MFRDARSSVVTLATLAVVALNPGCRRSSPPPPQATVASADLTPPPPPSRCEPPADGAMISLGEDKADDEGADSLPFAVEVGQGVATDDGFAVGALMPDKNGAKASVVTLSALGGSSRVVPLLTAHGDTPPPRIAPAGKSLLVGVLESAASNRRLRIGKVDAGAVTWGPSLDQSRDESLAFDLLATGSHAVAVWDDDSRDSDDGLIKLVSLDAATLTPAGSPRVVSPRGTDAEMPRLAARPGGFWLTWIRRKPEKVDDDNHEAGESPEFRWLEAVQLDERGVVVGTPRRVTSETGHVLVYDLRELPDGRAILVFRDDDTPSGSSGGILLRVVLRPDGASEPTVLADRQLGVGVPALLPGWIAMADALAETRLARLAPSGDLADRLESEPVLGRGEPLASRGDSLLVLRPRGKGVRLFVTRCRDQAPLPPGASAEPPPAAPPSRPSGPASARPKESASPGAKSARPPR